MTTQEYLKLIDEANEKEKYKAMILPAGILSISFLLCSRMFFLM